MSNAERQARFKERQRERDRVMVSVWVPTGSEQSVRHLAAHLTALAETKARDHRKVTPDYTPCNLPSIKCE